MTPTLIPDWLFGSDPVTRCEWAIHLAQPRFLLRAVGPHDWVIPLGNRTTNDLLIIKQAVAWYRKHMTQVAPDGPVTIVDAPGSIDQGPIWLCGAVAIDTDPIEDFYLVRARHPLAVFPIDSDRQLGDPIWLDNPDPFQSGEAHLIADQAAAVQRRYCSSP